MSIKSARLKSGKSVGTAARQLGLSRAALYYWENGKYQPTARNLQKLTKCYGCTYDELMAEEESAEDVEST